jgi:hypothetical protein
MIIAQICQGKKSIIAMEKEIQADEEAFSPENF